MGILYIRSHMSYVDTMSLLLNVMTYISYVYVMEMENSQISFSYMDS